MWSKLAQTRLAMISKEAMSRRMDREYGVISDAARDRMESYTYVEKDPLTKVETPRKLVDHEKELKGLRQGTENIVKKYNGVLTDLPPSQVGASIVGHIRDHAPGTKDILKTTSGIDLDKPRDFKAFASISGDAVAPGGGYGSFAHNGIVNRGNHDAKGSILNGLGEAKLKPKSLGSNYVAALLERHEADELRYGRQAMSNPKKIIAYKGEPLPATRSGSHLSTKVLGQESANVAKSPREARDYMLNVRKNSGEAFALKYQGIDYGARGKYNTSLNAKLERSVIKATMPGLKSAYPAAGITLDSKPAPYPLRVPDAVKYTPEPKSSVVGKVIKKLRK